MKKKSILIGKLLAILCIFLLFFSLINKEFRKAQLRTLNCFMPTSYTVLFSPSLPANKHDFDRYIFYYKLVSIVTKENSDAYALLGFCYSRIGQDKSAIKFMEKAIASKTPLFWAYYNLGVLYLKYGHYEKMFQTLTQAIHIEPQNALKAMYSSKIYTDLLASETMSLQDIANRLHQGYTNAYALLALRPQISGQQLPIEVTENLIRSVHVQIF